MAARADLPGGFIAEAITVRPGAAQLILDPGMGKPAGMRPARVGPEEPVGRATAKREIVFMHPAGHKVVVDVVRRLEPAGVAGAEFHAAEEMRLPFVVV